MNKNFEIKGLGNDIVEVDRIKNAINRYNEHFLNRVFTKNEKNYCLNYVNYPDRFAGRFAAKEAIVKALGVGIGDQISWKDLEIINDANGKPIVKLSDKVIKKFGNPNILISISHSKHYAIATAIWV